MLPSPVTFTLRKKSTNCKKTDLTEKSQISSGDPERARTSGLQIRNLPLYPLSYGIMMFSLHVSITVCAVCVKHFGRV